MGKSKPPAPPDPKETAAGSTSTNIGTAIANTTMGNVNRYTPNGTLEYTQRGSQKWSDPFTGKTYDVPQFSATETLSPGQQAIFDQSQQAKLGLSQGANHLSNALAQRSTAPIDTTAVENRLNDLGRQRLDPRFAREQATLENRLANQGLTQGSAAWDAEMQNFGQNKNDAYNQLALNGRGQATSEAMALRNQPINEISALLSGSQVQTPNFGINSPSKMATTDVAGLVNNNYNQRLGIYNQQQAQQQQLMGGLFGLFSKGLMASDRRLKKDIVLIGNNGLNIYQYRYKWENSNVPLRTGYMAQEVVVKFPDAVRHFGKWMAIDYSKLEAV